MPILEWKLLFDNLLYFLMLLEKSKVTTLEGKKVYSIENKQLKLSEFDTTLPIYNTIYKPILDLLTLKLPDNGAEVAFEKEVNSIYTNIFSPTEYRSDFFTDFLERLAWHTISRVFKDFSISPNFQI